MNSFEKPSLITVLSKRMIPKVILLSTIILMNCTNKSTTEPGKSRLDRVREMPFRTTSVSDELRIELFEIGELAWNEFIKSDTAGQATLVSSLNEDEFSRLHLSLDKIDSLRDISYQMWRDNEVAWTALVYKSSSHNSHTNALSTFYVIEIEDRRLTGTCYIFDPSGTYQLDNLRLTYQDRN